MWRDLGRLCVLVAATSGAFAFMRETPSRAGPKTLEDAWGALARCLAGATLGEGERASLRVRGVELRLLATEGSRAPSERWPRRCGVYARSLHEALSYGPAPSRDVVASLLELSHAVGEIVERDDGAAPELEDGPVDELFAIAAARGLTVPYAADVPPTNAPRTLDDLRRTAPLPAAALEDLTTDRVPGGVLRLLVGESLCEVDARGERATCAKIPASIGEASRDVRLFGSAEDGAASLLFAAPSGEPGIFRSDTGERVEAAPSYGGFARKDGFSAVLGWDTSSKQFGLTRARPGKPPRTLYFSMRSILFENMVAVLWDHIVYAESGTLSVDRILDGDSATTPTRTIGALPRIDPVGEALRACKAGDALFVVVRAEGSDRVAIGRGDVWRGPFAASGTGGELGCVDDAAWLTRTSLAIERGAVTGKIEQERCGDDGCAAKSVDLGALFGDSSSYRPERARDLVATMLDGKLLVVWRSPRGGIRLRLAPIDAITGADDAIVLDDLVSDGALTRGSTALGLRVFARPGFAALGIATRLGVHLLRVGKGGAVTSIPVDVTR